MLILRCTQKLLRRLEKAEGSESVLPPSTTALGDWYANALYGRHYRLILCTSERSLLSVVLPSRDLKSLIPRFQQAVNDLLTRLGIPAEARERESKEMLDVCFGPTASRGVLGSMNDLAVQCRFRLEEDPHMNLSDLALQLSEVPCGPLKYRYPAEVAIELLQKK
jgi:hypothetical protein